MTELERIWRSNRRTTVFWLCVTVAMLVYCLSAAFAYQPAIWHNGKGPALIVISAGYFSWFVYGNLRSFRRKEAATNHRTMLWQQALRLWGSIFAVYVVMTALSPMMGWMFWATFGLALTIFRLPWVLLPVGLSLAGVLYTLIVIAQPPPDAILWIVLSISMTSICVGYAMYSGNQAMRERLEREHAFSALEDMHRQLADAHYQLELSAERDAQLAIISERNRLAREMHDTIGQALVLIVVKLEAAQRLRTVQPERAEHELEAIKEMVRTTMRDLRDSLADLRLPIVSEHSIGEILARRTRESSGRAGFLVTYKLQPDLDQMNVAIREALYRITIEALTNIEKHAHARAVTLSLSCCDSAITLQITDDGVGLSVAVTAGGRPAWPAKPSSPPGHYGITGMRERAEALGGSLIVESRPGQGTTIKASIPLSMDSHRSSADGQSSLEA